MDPQGRIQVVVRVRPVLPHEAGDALAVTCTQDGKRVQVTLPERESNKPAIAANARPDAKAYEFDACLNGSTTQEQLFDLCGMEELVEAAVDGYNVTVFAFGQTGSGKSHSIIGRAASLRGSSAPTTMPASAGDNDSADQQLPVQTEEQRPGSSSSGGSSAQAGTAATKVVQLGEEDGLLPRSVAHLYRSIAARSQDVACSVTTSCCEIYNEAVTDLLSQNKTQQLQVRQDKADGFFVDGLTQAPAADARTALGMMSRALAWRHTRSHKLNAYSSRSHCLMSFAVTSQERVGQQPGMKGGLRRTGKLMLVDLAGSERLRDTGNSGREAVRETGAINKSLFTLGQVLAALSVRGGCGVTGHVPYRDSRLTQLLWDGLKGGSRTLMLACLSPLTVAADESLNTLHFASVALKIKSSPVIIMDPADQMVLEMRDTIRDLQDDCRSLAGALAQMTQGADVTSVLDALPPTLLQDALRYGSSSAPTTQQGSRGGGGRPSGSRGVLGSSVGRSMQQLRNSGSGSGAARLKASGLLNKPSSACDVRLHHSLPSLPHCNPERRGGGSSNSRSGATKQPKQRQQLQQQPQQQPAWNTSQSLQVLSGNTRSSWPAFLTPPKTRLVAGCSSSSTTGQEDSHPLAVAAAGWFGSLRGQQQLQPAARAAAGPGGSLAVPCMAYSSSDYSGAAGRWRAGDEASVRMCQAAAAAGNVAAAERAAAGHKQPSAASFPELQALEQQFQQMMAHQQGFWHAPQHQPSAAAVAAFGFSPSDSSSTADMAAAAAGAAHAGATVPFMGADGLLLPSSLAASILSPRTLLPLRLSVADTEVIGTRPDVSPVVVALAAANSHVRPIAVPLPPVVHGGSDEPAAPADAATDASAAAGAVSASGTMPEPKALSFAQRNLWFGADHEMTNCAYQAHDELCAAGLDPASDAYYDSIESRVAHMLPEKWRQWQGLMLAVQQQAASAGAAPHGRLQQSMSPVSFNSCRVPLKEPVPKFDSCPPPTLHCSPPGNRQQHQQQVKHTQPFLAGGHASLHQQQLQQLEHEPLQQLCNGSQQGSAAFGQQYSQQQQQAAGLEPDATSRAADLPELQQSASPVPPADADLGANRNPSGNISSSSSKHAGVKAFGSAGGTGMYSTVLSTTDCDTGSRRSGPSQAFSNMLHPPQPVSLLSGESAARFGVAAAAVSEALASSVPSFYNGAGPLTAGARKDWKGISKSSGSSVQAGKDLAQVLRSGYSPGNKSLAEIQADYRAARGLLMDQLKCQKEAAELQRKQILLHIGRAINSNKWH